MAVESLAPELVTSLQQSARDILETMVFVTPTAIEEIPETTSVFRDEVVGLLSFTGTRNGTFAVRTTDAVARLITAKMLMMNPAEMGDFELAADGFGELVNMIGGNFKNAWVATGNQMDLSMPNVIHKGRVSLNTALKGALRSCIRIRWAEGVLLVGVHFEAM